MALLKSQASLHCRYQLPLYSAQMTLGDRIQKARCRLKPKPTQAKIGAQFGITDKAVSAWERGDTIPDLEKIPKLARILRVPLAWLMDGKGDPPHPDDYDVLIEDLNPEELAAVSALIETFRKRRNIA